MFKAMIILKRKDGTNLQEFADWWLVRHRPLAERLPGLKRAFFNLADEETADSFDGIAELWFDTKADFQAAYASDIGKAVAEDSLKHVATRTRLFVTEHTIKS